MADGRFIFLDAFPCTDLFSKNSLKPSLESLLKDSCPQKAQTTQEKVTNGDWFKRVCDWRGCLTK